MRRRISSHIRWARFIFIAVGIVLLYILITSSINHNNLNESIGIVLLLLACCGLYYLFDIAKIVEFDDNFMYVISKAGEKEIPLKDVYKIKLTMTKINNRNMWKIGYYDEHGNDRSVRILPSWFHQDFDRFKEQVKAANQKVKIKNWSHSFDLDQ